MEGWIKLLRKFLDWEWFQKPEMVQLFVYLLLKANYAPAKWQGIDLKAGQFAISKSKIMTETGLSEQTIKTCFKRLISTNEITIESTNRYSIITICKYDTYQVEESLSNRQTNQQTNQQSTNEQPTTNQQLTNDQPTIIIRSKEREEEKEYKEKEEENILSRKLDNISSPPTGEEAFAPALAREGEVSKPEETFLKPSVPAPAKKQKPLPAQKQPPLQAQKIQDMWNATCSSYPKIFTLSENRKNKIRIRIEEMGGEDKALPLLQVLFEKMQASNFLKGDNQRGWKASFDWLFENDKNWVKVHEGNYDKTQSGSNSKPEEPKQRNYDEKLF